MTVIRAIPTVYKGILLKSRLEGDIAYLVDNLGYKWRYEPQSYKLENGFDRTWPHTRDFSHELGQFFAT